MLLTRPAFSQSARSTLDETLESAQHGLVEKDYQKAAREYREASKIKATPEIFEKLGLAYFLGNSYPEAIDAFSETLRLDSKRWASHLFLGISLYKSNRFQEALPHIEQALQLNPQQNDARYWLGLTYNALGDYQEGTGQLWAALDKNPENIDLLYALTEAYLDLSTLLSKRMEPYHLAKEHREALENRVGLKKLGAGISDKSWEQLASGWREMESQFRGIMKSPQADVDGLYILSRVCEKLAQLTAQRVWTLKPDSYRAHQLLGEANEAKEDFEKALAEYREALRLSPQAQGLHYSLGHAYWKMKRFDEAIPELEKELTLNPHNASANFVLGHIYAYRRDLAKSSKYLQRAVKEKPDFVEARKQLGKVLSLMEDNQGAVRQLEVAMASDPEDYSVHYSLAGVYRKLGWPEKARKELAIFNQLYSREHQHQHTAELPE